MTRTHPATYTPIIERKIVQLLGGRPGFLLDPFAGEGASLEAFAANGRRDVVGLEIEKPWADASPLIINADSTRMPIGSGRVDFIVTSPCYGNRFADHHTPRNGEAPDARRGYTFDIRRLTGDVDYQLAETNAGRFGIDTLEYATLHATVYAECTRVAADGAEFILNVKNFIRRGGEVNVVRWHVDLLRSLGWEPVEPDGSHWVPTPGMRRGANGKARVPGEWIIQLRRTS